MGCGESPAIATEVAVEGGRRRKSRSKVRHRLWGERREGFTFCIMKGYLFEINLSSTGMLRVKWEREFDYIFRLSHMQNSRSIFGNFDYFNFSYFILKKLIVFKII